METNLRQLREKGDFTGNVYRGFMYTFKYRALKERANEYPYFDRYPVILCINRHNAMTFDGINFNYIDISARAELLEALKSYFLIRNNRRFFDWREFMERIHLRVFRYAKLSLRRYRYKGCYAGIVRVKDDIWEDTIMEENEKFFKMDSTGSMTLVKSVKVWRQQQIRARIYMGEA